MRPLRKFLISLFFTLAAWPARPAYADPPKRAPQDYGAPDPGTSAGEVALWVPRVVFFPLWLVSEFLVRRPVGALVKAAEKGEWAQELIDFFTFGERQQITVYPSALFDFGLLPSVGFNFTHKYFISDPNTLRFHFGTWGIDWISARANDTYEFGKGETVTVDVSFVRRQDNPFYGMGPRSGSHRARYDSTTIDTGLEYNRRLWRSSSFNSRSGFRSLGFDEGSCCDDLSLNEEIRRGRFPAPPGFEDGYFAGYHRLSLALDSRKPKPDEGSGVRIEAHGEGTYAPDTRRGYERRAWVRYGGSVGAAVDVTGHERNVAVSVAADFADPLNGTIPFTDQVILGGDTFMRGYLRNRLIDRSALIGTFQYTWPVWVFLDGVITVDAGNVFGEHLSGFKPGLLRLSSGVGVRSNGHRDSAFEILVAAATDPLDEGFSVSSFRLVFGSHHGF